MTFDWPGHIECLRLGVIRSTLKKAVHAPEGVSARDAGEDG